MDGIFLISKQYINADDLTAKIQKVTQNLQSIYTQYNTTFPINIVVSQ